MSKQKILYYTVKYYQKNQKDLIRIGYVCIKPFTFLSYQEVIATIDTPEHMALLMDKNNVYDFVVLSGVPFYENELKKPENDNKGLVYDSVLVGIYIHGFFDQKLYYNHNIYGKYRTKILLEAGIYFLQWHSNRKRTEKKNDINRTVLYLRTLRYLKEKHNISLF